MSEYKIMDQTVREAGLESCVNAGQEDWILAAKCDDECLWDQTFLWAIKRRLDSDYASGGSVTFNGDGYDYLAIDPRHAGTFVQVEQWLEMMAAGTHLDRKIYDDAVHEQVQDIWADLPLVDRIDFALGAGSPLREALADEACTDIQILLEERFEIH